MSLLPKQVSATPAVVRRFAGGGGLGYESQLGAGLSSNSAAARVGNALYQNLPPLALPYVPVKQAAAIDTAAAIAAADEEGKKQADKLKDEYQKLYNEATKDARMTAAHRGELARRWDSVLGELQTNVTQNPLYFASQANRVSFQQKALQALNQGDIASYRNQYDGLLKTSEQLQQAKQDGYKAYIGGVRSDFTNKQVLDAALSETNLDKLSFVTGMRALQTADGRIDFGRLNLGVKNGNEDDALQEFKGFYLDVPTSTSGSKGERMSTGKIGSLGQEHVITEGGGSQTTTNKSKIEQLAKVINGNPQGWRSIGFSEQAQYGLYEPKAAAWDDTALQNPLTITDAKGQAQEVGAGTMTRGQVIQLAIQAGDRETYRKLTGLRDKMVGQQIANQLTTQLGLKVVNGTVTEQSISVGARTDDAGTEGSNAWDKFADYGFDGPGINGNSDQVVTTNHEGKAVAIPVNVKSFAQDPEMMKIAQEFITKNVLDPEGKGYVNAPKTAQDIGDTHTIYSAGMDVLQAPGRKLKNADKMLLRNPKGEIAYFPRNPDDAGRYKAELAALNAEINRTEQARTQGQMSEREYTARRAQLRNTATQRGFVAFMKFGAVASEETWKQNESALGSRSVRVNGKSQPRKFSDYLTNYKMVNDEQDERSMQNLWGLRPATDTDALKTQGVFGSERFGRNAYETDVWISVDNLHTLGTEKSQRSNLPTNATLVEGERQQAQQGVVQGANPAYR